MARKKRPPVAAADKALIGNLLRDLRRGAGYRSVETAAARNDCPASRQTIYAYERGDLVPSLPQFLDLVEFYVLDAPHGRGAKPEDDLRAQGVAAVAHALALDAYHVPHATELVARMRPDRVPSELTQPERTKPERSRKA
jgi:DNA-binding XRE family transcriptional regulator